MRVFSRAAIEIFIGLAQSAYSKGVCTPNPLVGQLVFEPTMLWCRGPRVGRVAADVDAIGWLVARGIAPYATDGQLRGQQLAGLAPHVDARFVFDIIPLTGRRPEDAERLYLRFENAEFLALPDDIAELAR